MVSCFSSLLLLASFCLGRQWSMCPRLFCGCGASAAVTLQSDPVAACFVAVIVGVVSAWLCDCWCYAHCCLHFLLTFHWSFFLCPLMQMPAFEEKPSTAAVCGYSFPACWVDVACFFVKNGSSFRSGDSMKQAHTTFPWGFSYPAFLVFLLGIIFSFSECNEWHLRRVPLLLIQCCYLGCNY